MSGTTNSGRAHPSLAKLRDNLINGTIDFAEIPIIDMNPGKKFNPIKFAE
jgi:hypothetical protein